MFIEVKGNICEIFVPFFLAQYIIMSYICHMETNTVEYSKDFNFFLNHQIAVAQSKLGFIKYFSRLDGRLFLGSVVNHYLSDIEIKNECEKIHKKLHSK